MPFTDDFINKLGDESDRRVARLFNEIPTSPGYLKDDMSGMYELVEKLNIIRDLIKNPSVKNIKDNRGNDITNKLKSMNPKPGNLTHTQYSMSELAKISSMLKNQYPENMALAKAIDEYVDAYYLTYKALNKPSGIYQILVGAQLLLDRNIPHQYDKSEEGQLFLLKTIVKPIIDIYEELETRNLQAKDVMKIRLLIREMENELELLDVDTNKRIEEIQGEDSVSKFKKEKLAVELEQIKRFSEGVKKELNHICDKIIAVETHAMAKQLQGHAKGDELKKAQKEIITGLNREASKTKNLDFILQSRFREYGEEKAEKHHGSQVLPLNQSKLPEMGSSEGLCFGYSSLFLDVCMAPDWNNLTREERVSKFKEHLAPHSSDHEKHRANRLKMNLAAGLRYDAQFIKSCPEAIYKDVKAANGKKLNLAKQLANSLIDKAPPQDILIAIYSKKSAHALSFREDLDGNIWFHDSNSGLYSFANKKDFSNFLKKYLSTYYNGFDQEFKLYDYKLLRQIADNNLVIPNVSKSNKNDEKTEDARDEPLLDFSNTEEQLLRNQTPIKKVAPLLISGEQKHDKGVTQENKRQPFERAQATRLLTHKEPVALSPINEMIENIQKGLSNLNEDSLTIDNSVEIVSPLITRLQNLEETDKSSVEKLALAKDILKEFRTNALKSNRAHMAIKIIYLILENLPNHAEKNRKPQS